MEGYPTQEVVGNEKERLMCSVIGSESFLYCCYGILARVVDGRGVGGARWQKKTRGEMKNASRRGRRLVLEVYERLAALLGVSPCADAPLPDPFAILAQLSVANLVSWVNSFQANLRALPLLECPSGGRPRDLSPRTGIDATLATGLTKARKIGKMVWDACMHGPAPRTGNVDWKDQMVGHVTTGPRSKQVRRKLDKRTHGLRAKGTASHDGSPHFK